MKKRIKVGVAAVSVFVFGVLVGAWGTEFTIRYRAERYGAETDFAAASFALGERHFDRAQAHAYAALSKYPNWYSAYALLGEIFSQTGNTDAALAMYRIAVEKTAYEQPASTLFGKHGEYPEIEKEIFLRKIETLKNSEE